MNYDGIRAVRIYKELGMIAVDGYYENCDYKELGMIAVDGYYGQPYDIEEDLKDDEL